MEHKPTAIEEELILQNFMQNCKNYITKGIQNRPIINTSVDRMRLKIEEQLDSIGSVFSNKFRLNLDSKAIISEAAKSLPYFATNGGISIFLIGLIVSALNAALNENDLGQSPDKETKAELLLKLAKLVEILKDVNFTLKKIAKP